MKIAYLVLAHKNPAQCRKLIEALLEDEECIVVSHIDRSKPLKGFTVSNERAFYLKKRLRIVWGSFSIICATLLLIQKALDLGADYLYLLSGMDFPIRSMTTIHTELEKDRDTLLMEMKPVTRDTVKEYERLHNHKCFFFKAMFLNWLINKTILRIENILCYSRVPPEGVKPYYGSQWWGMPASAGRGILREIADHMDFFRYYRWVGIPDEQFFQTCYASFCERIPIARSNRKHIRWEQRTPRVLSEEDLPLLNESDDLFARKFDEKKHPGILDCIKTQLGKR